MTEQLWLAIISSSVLTAVVGALINGAYHLRTKQNEYSNDFYKTVVRKRIAAYEQLQSLILAIKTSVLDTDNRPYHLLFSTDDDSQSVHNLLLNVMSQSLWLGDEAFEKTRELNYLVFPLTRAGGGVIEFGKQNYSAIANLRVDLERILTADMLHLHEVRRFFKRKKKKQSGFRPLLLNSGPTVKPDHVFKPPS